MEPNKELLSDSRIPTITLAGQKWPVPKLAIKQLAEVVPLIVDERGAMRRPRFDAAGVRDMTTVAYWAIERGHKGLTREQFDEMPISMDELLEAFAFVGLHTGALRPLKPGESNGVAHPLGETAATLSPTG
jgi:hypothetical protein